MSRELAKTYDPQEVEDRIYDFWLNGGYFHATVDPEKNLTPSSSRRPISPANFIWDMRWMKPFRIF